MKKKIVSALILTALTIQLAGCVETGTPNADESQSTESNTLSQQPSESETIYNTTEEPKGTESAAPTETVDITTNESEKTETADNTAEEITLPVQTAESTTNRQPIVTEAVTEKNDIPKWTETEISAELYVNTDNIYSRVSAIQGSTKVKQYKLNEKVTVVAKTNTSYFKLNDGTFIHQDYLSENEVEIKTEYGGDYTSATNNGYEIKRVNGITYVDGIMIANKTYTLPRSYDPGIRQEAADALAQMQNAAAAEGLSLFIVSGYRSYSRQEAVYAGWVSSDGAEKADTYSSRPGHSDHQTGYAFDLNSLSQTFAYTQEGIWLAEHCADYGFIIRYPEGKEMYTGYIYEPWHVRYIGREKAKIITESGLSLEEYYGFTSDYADCQDN